MDRFAANQDLTIDIVPLGLSGERMLVIDDFLADPAALVATASNARDWRDLPPGGYPGRRASLPAPYVRSVLRRIDGPIRRMLFAEKPMRLDRFECSFSMVTRAPSALTDLQRVPHIDVAQETRVAILHYLCGSQFGGTAFYRQSATGLEQIGPADRTRYLEARAHGLSNLGPENGYPNERTPGYERTARTEACFNRLIAYRSFTLHSGIIDRPDILSEDSASGRLTANFFVDYAPSDC